MKILVVFCTHNINQNLVFFLKYGYYDSLDTDFYICINNPTLDISSVAIPKHNLFIVNRENIGYDFGAWTEILLAENRYQNYDYFVIINNTCMGPFVPIYVKDRWTDLLVGQINEMDKLVGATINHYRGKPHVQSYFMFTDRVGMNVGIKNKIFSYEINDHYRYKDMTITKNKEELIETYEVGYSQHILDAGYNIKALTKGLDQIDFRVRRHDPNLVLDHGTTNWDLAYPNLYFGININPYEVMFFKSNRNITTEILNKYIGFYDSAHNRSQYPTNLCQKKTLGFVVVRRITKPEYYDMWKECYDCIRKFYDEEIIIVDNGSDPSLVDDTELVNIHIVKSAYPDAGMLAGYYYFYLMKPFEKAIIIPDSMFFKQIIDFQPVCNIRFLWHFTGHDADEVELEQKYIQLLKPDPCDSLQIFYKNKQWHGCFGSAAVVDHDFIAHLENTYEIFKLLYDVNTIYACMAMERIVGLLAFFDKKVSTTDCSLFGDINHHFQRFALTFDQYKHIDVKHK